MFIVMGNCFMVDLLIVEFYMFIFELVRYDKIDGQWYNYDGVDIKDMQ